MNAATVLRVLICFLLGGLGAAVIFATPPAWQGLSIGLSMATAYWLGHTLNG